MQRVNVIVHNRWEFSSGISSLQLSPGGRAGPFWTEMIVVLIKYYFL